MNAIPGQFWDPCLTARGDVADAAGAGDGGATPRGWDGIQRVERANSPADLNYLDLDLQHAQLYR